MKWLKAHVGETAYRAIRTFIQVAAGVLAAGVVEVATNYTPDGLRALIVLAVATALAAAMNIVSKDGDGE